MVGSSLRHPRAIAVFVALAAVAAFVAVPIQLADASGRTTLYVASSGSDGGANTCAKKLTPCMTITYALTKVSPFGSTIQLLDAGPFPEQVTVNKNNVTINSAGGSTIQPVTANTNAAKPDATPVISMLNVAPGITGFVLNNVTVDGSAAGLPFCSATPYYGVYVHSAVATLNKDHITHIQAATLSGCQNGVGLVVRSDASTTANLAVNGVSVIDTYNKNGVVCADPGTTCAFLGTTVTGVGPTPLIAQNGIEYISGAGGSIRQVKVSGNAYTGTGTGATGVLLIDTGAVLLAGSEVSANNNNIYAFNDGTGGPGQDTANVSITNSKVHDAVANGDPTLTVSDGIDVDGVTGGTVMGNKVWGNKVGGINAWGIEFTTIKMNTVNDGGVSDPNGTGIFVGSYAGNVNATSSSNNTAGNVVTNNLGDGIQADASATGNVFSNNKLTNNHQPGFFDAHDLSTGPGTAGTANNWSGNTCHLGTSSPAGLCH